MTPDETKIQWLKIRIALLFTGGALFVAGALFRLLYDIRELLEQILSILKSQ